MVHAAPASASRPRMIMDAAHSWIVAPSALESWLANAEPHDRMIYAVGPTLPQGTATVVMVSELVALGKLRTHVRRNPETKALEHVAFRQPELVPVAAARDEGADRFINPRHVHMRMLTLLVRAADRGRSCPTNGELAEGLGLKNAEAARYIFRQLVRAGKIRCADHGPRMRRVVTIVASGKTTAKGAL